MAGKVGDDNGGIFDINVTPLVDVVLVLLIIFMVTATFIMAPIVKVELPRAVSEDHLEQDRPTLSIYLSKDGKLALAGVMKSLAGKDQVIVKPSELSTWLERAKSKFPNLQVAIQADREVPFGKVMGLVDRIKRAGISNFAFNVDPNAIDMLEE